MNYEVMNTINIYGKEIKWREELVFIYLIFILNLKCMKCNAHLLSSILFSSAEDERLRREGKMPPVRMPDDTPDDEIPINQTIANRANQSSAGPSV